MPPTPAKAQAIAREYAADLTRPGRVAENLTTAATKAMADAAKDDERADSAEQDAAAAESTGDSDTAEALRKEAAGYRQDAETRRTVAKNFQANSEKHAQRGRQAA
jgi:DNA-binding IclR family transcriptional regulator